MGMGGGGEGRMGIGREPDRAIPTPWEKTADREDAKSKVKVSGLNECFICMLFFLWRESYKQQL